MPSVFMKEVCLEQVDGATTKVVERGLPFDRFTTAPAGAWRCARRDASRRNLVLLPRLQPADGAGRIERSAAIAAS
jgi:hypothetical protein